MNIALLILLIGQWLMALVSMGTKNVTSGAVITQWLLALGMTIVVAACGGLVL